MLKTDKLLIVLNTIPLVFTTQLFFIEEEGGPGASSGLQSQDIADLLCLIKDRIFSFI